MLKTEVSLPQRQHAVHSVSKHIKRHMGNPRVFDQVVKVYGYKLEKSFYPDCHLLPPFLEKIADDNAGLEKMKAETCLERAEGDWRAIFMDCEFVSVLKK